MEISLFSMLRRSVSAPEMAGFFAVALDLLTVSRTVVETVFFVLVLVVVEPFCFLLGLLLFLTLAGRNESLFFVAGDRTD